MAITVSSNLKKANVSIPFTFDDQELKGGFRCVTSLADRDAIPIGARRSGMIVRVVTEFSVTDYTLPHDNLSNSGWVEEAVPVVDFNIPIKIVDVEMYNVVAEDAHHLLVTTSDSPVFISVGNLALEAGAEIHILQGGLGDVTVEAVVDPGVFTGSIYHNWRTNNVTFGKGAAISLKLGFVSPSEAIWFMFGSSTPSVLISDMRSKFDIYTHEKTIDGVPTAFVQLPYFATTDAVYVVRDGATAPAGDVLLDLSSVLSADVAPGYEFEVHNVTTSATLAFGTSEITMVNARDALPVLDPFKYVVFTYAGKNGSNQNKWLANWRYNPVAIVVVETLISYLAVSQFNSPFISIYKQEGDVLTKLADPDVLPPGQGYEAAFSPDGNYLAVATYDAPGLIIYRRNGDTFTKLADPAIMPAGNATDVSFSPDGMHLAVAHSASPFVNIYERNGDTFTKLADLTDPPSKAKRMDYSENGDYLAIAHNDPFGGAGPYLFIYKRVGSVYTKLPPAATQPTGRAWDVAFSPDDLYLTVAHNNAPFLTVYKRDGDTFNKLPDPATLPVTDAIGLSFSPDGNYVATAHYDSPYISIFKRNGDEFTRLPNPDFITPSEIYNVSFSHDGNYLAASHYGGDTFTVYKRNGDAFNKIAPPAELPTQFTNSVDYSRAIVA